MNNSLYEISERRGNLYYIPPTKINIDPSFNARDDYGDIPTLAKDIAQNGVDIPLIVRSDAEHGIVLTDGHRRLRAVMYAIEHLSAPIDTIPCIKEKKGSNEETRLISMFSTGSNTKPLEPLEQAKVVKRLIDMGWKTGKIATQLGRSQACIYQLIELNGAPTEVRQAVESKKISATAAKKLSHATKEKRAEVLGKTGKVKSKDVEKAMTGSQSTVTAKQIRKYISKVDGFIKAGVKVQYWLAVKFGLQVALGTAEL